VAAADDRRVEHLVDDSPALVVLNIAFGRHSGLGNPPSRNQLRQAIESHAMRLFKSDLYRNFAIGFAIGAMIVGVQAGPQVWGQFVPQAQAHSMQPAG
jgi:hypothetical protein